MRRLLLVMVCCGVAPTLVSCQSDRPAARHAAPTNPIAPPSIDAQAPVDYPGLPNVVTYHHNYICGGAPEGDQGFETLRAMGVKTIISVDGSATDPEAAHAHGMRYIHLPIGYDGFGEARRLQLIRASRDALELGPVYVHCHHGKHRSAGAAATVAASLGWDTPEQAVARMRVSGTSPNYQGLFACAEHATPVTEAQIDAVPANFPEVSRPEGYRKAMVEIDEVDEHLADIERAGWKTPDDHPDLVPVAEAGRLADLLRYCAQSDRASSEPPGFAAGLTECQSLAQQLEDMLDAGAEPAALSKQYTAVGAQCSECHKAYRN